MREEDRTRQDFHYLVVVEFQLDRKGISGDEPAGKVVLRGSYDLSRRGQQEFINTLSAYFEQVTLIVVDLAEKLSGSKLVDS